MFRLGNQAEWINSRNCEELKGMILEKDDPQWTKGMRYTQEWVAAVEDRLQYEACGS